MFSVYDTWFIPSLGLRVIILEGPVFDKWHNSNRYLADIGGRIDWYVEEVLVGMRDRALHEEAV